jgi:hypothetical protein
MSLCQNDIQLKKQNEELATSTFMPKQTANLNRHEASQLLQNAFGVSANLRNVDLSTLITTVIADQGRTLSTLSNANMTTPNASQPNFPYRLHQGGSNVCIPYDSFKQQERNKDPENIGNQLGNMISLQRMNGQSIMVPHPMQGAILPYRFTPSLTQSNTTITNFLSSNINAPMRSSTSMMTSQEPSIPNKLPFCLAQPADHNILSEHQQFLRFQIEVFEASEKDVRTHVRGRNKPIVLGQVGIRCRHCAHLTASRRQKGAMYFPASTIGLYQAAQNMCTAHIQCGLCTEMPDPIKDHFKQLIATKSFTSGAGKPYWSKSAKAMGLVDTEEGIFFIRNVRFLK